MPIAKAHMITTATVTMIAIAGTLAIMSVIGIAVRYKRKIEALPTMELVATIVTTSAMAAIIMEEAMAAETTAAGMVEESEGGCYDRMTWG